MDICKALLNARLCYTRFSCGALASAGAVFRRPSPFEIIKVGSSEGLVKSGTSAESITQLAARAQDLMRSRGCANMMELADAAREIFGSEARQPFIEAAIRTVPRFEWLNQETGWFWYRPDRGHGSNRLVNQIRRILAVTPRIQFADLRSAIGRDHCLRNFAPPTDVLASICQRLLFAHVEGDVVVRIPGLAQWDAVLSSNEKTLVKVLQAHGPVLGRKDFLERCREHAMIDSTFNQFISRSVILNTTAPGMYALIGAKSSARESIRSSSPEAAVVTADHGCLSGERVFLAWKLDPSILRSGVLRVPEPVNTSVEGKFRLKTVTNCELGFIQIFQRACWDVRRLLQYACSETDDTLVIVLSLRDQHAIGILGDETIAALVKSGEFDLDRQSLDAHELIPLP